MTVAEAVAALDAYDPLVVAIGASAGAVEALGQLLPQLPASLSAPVVVVVHVPPDRPSGLAQLFAGRCQVPVSEVEDKRPLQSGVFFAPPDYHVLIERTRTLALSNDEAVHFSRPSIDVLFESVAASFQHRGMGILLSGASVDGAAGLQRIQQAGGLTWVQTPSTATVATMPESALALARHAVLTADVMGHAFARWRTERD
jgi:two-component system chemotaxis response regulator CheB